MYELLAISLSLSGLLAINCFASVVAVLFWRAISRAAGRWPSSTRAQFLVLLRIAPGLVAILCVAALFIPAYLAHEPRQTTEIVTAKLGILAALSLFGIGFAIWHGFATSLATRRLVKNWLKHAEPVELENASIPAWRIQHRFPVVAIVGVFRPRLFIADQIFRSLSEEEMLAAVSHENGHLAAADNLKRGLLIACRNVLSVVPLGRSIERAWNEAAESAADEYAAGGGASVALDLASALVKVARLVPRGSTPVILAGASLISQDLSSIRARVLRLTQIASQSNAPQKSKTHVLNLGVGACLSGTLLGIALAVSSPEFLATIHSAVEYVVSALQ